MAIALKEPRAEESALLTLASSCPEPAKAWPDEHNSTIQVWIWSQAIIGPSYRAHRNYLFYLRGSEGFIEAKESTVITKAAIYSALT